MPRWLDEASDAWRLLTGVLCAAAWTAAGYTAWLFKRDRSDSRRPPFGPMRLQLFAPLVAQGTVTAWSFFRPAPPVVDGYRLIAVSTNIWLVVALLSASWVREQSLPTNQRPRRDRHQGGQRRGEPWES